MAIVSECDLIALELMEKGADVDSILVLDFQSLKFFSRMLEVYGLDAPVDDDFAKKLKVRMRECDGKA
ncbi:MAG: hypothetical protein B0D91_08990 [Oceanospirillales bacterium LUC14_002_19_P2]|nr:MAG: hypothetical protein B0D91_08990 [Oceanospirillales bacterium LUC14_002_19_P2]